jgi:hypothetical protein
MAVGEYNGKKFNTMVFEKYLDRVPNLARNELIKNGVYDVKNKYKNLMTNQDGGDYIITPIKGLLDGEVQNYDGIVSMTPTSTKTFTQGKPVFGRMKAWQEKDFAMELTGIDWIKDIASEVASYYEGVDQADLVAILTGIFAMPTDSGYSATGNADFITKHTYDITSAVSDADKLVSATTLNNAVQKALGANKGIITLAFMNSVVATNLENLSLLSYMLYNDANGVQRQLNIGTWNGRVVIVDDDLPTTETVTTAPVYSTTISTPAVAGDKITINGTEYTFVANSASDTGNKIKVGADGTAPQQATNIASKVTITGYTITASSSKVVFTADSGTNPDRPVVVATQKESDGAIVIANATDTAPVVATNYITYLLGRGAFEYENIGVRVASEVSRDPATNGGIDVLYTRQRHLVAPKWISYTKASQETNSATTAELATGANWELVNDGALSGRLFVDHKAIPIVRIISRG